MKATELIKLLQDEVKRVGDHQVVINDSHANTCDIKFVRYERYVHPMIVIEADIL